ncbi:MAG: methyltransferase [Deltaproteobacteria bacterium]|nr:methyltransferase [Deltaproteobacteria bacterium]
MAGRDQVTVDTLWGGRLPIAQRAVGYRTNVDALWLAAFAAAGASAAGAKPARACVDLGAGVGVVGLALVVDGAARGATLLEIDPALVELARRNAEAAHVADRVDVRESDLRGPLVDSLRHRFDLVVANPPWAARPTRPSPDAAKARARTADPATLPGFVRAARAALGAAGRACFVYPATELPHLFRALREVGLEPKRLRLVHPLPDAPARAALVEAKPARPGGLRVEAPFFAMRAPSIWSDEATRIIGGRLRD